MAFEIFDSITPFSGSLLCLVLLNKTGPQNVWVKLLCVNLALCFEVLVQAIDTGTRWSIQLIIFVIDFLLPRNDYPIWSTSTLGGKPSFTYLWVIGANGYAANRVPSTGHKKLIGRRTICVIIGYDGKHIYQMLHPEGNIISVSNVDWNREKRPLLEGSWSGTFCWNFFLCPCAR